MILSFFIKTMSFIHNKKTRRQKSSRKKSNFEGHLKLLNLIPPIFLYNKICFWQDVNLCFLNIIEFTFHRI